MEELWEGLNELKGMATPQEEQQYKLARPLRAPSNYTNQRVYMGRFMAPQYLWSRELLIWRQWEGWHLVLWRLDAPEKGDARGIRWEWLGGEGAKKGLRKGRAGRGITLEM